MKTLLSTGVIKTYLITHQKQEELQKRSLIRIEQCTNGNNVRNKYYAIRHHMTHACAQCDLNFLYSQTCLIRSRRDPPKKPELSKNSNYESYVVVRTLTGITFTQIKQPLAIGLTLLIQTTIHIIWLIRGIMYKRL